jgi:hypothetical protein
MVTRPKSTKEALDLGRNGNISQIIFLNIMNINIFITNLAYILGKKNEFLILFPYFIRQSCPCAHPFLPLDIFCTNRGLFVELGMNVSQLEAATAFITNATQHALLPSSGCVKNI